MERAIPPLHQAEGRSMTLARGKVGGYEFNRMVVLFSMVDGAREIPCAVSASAMDEIEHVSRTAPDQREQQFLRLRDRIEQCASRNFSLASSKVILPASYAVLIFANSFETGIFPKQVLDPSTRERWYGRNAILMF